MKNKDVIAVLKDDHKRVRDLLAELEQTTERGSKRREELLNEIVMELKIHTQVEEEIVYPAFRQMAANKQDQKLFYEAKEEHHVVDLVLPEVQEMDPARPEFSAKATVLKELVEHHVKEEETEMFPHMRKGMSKEELIELGARVTARKTELKDSKEALS